MMTDTPDLRFFEALPGNILLARADAPLYTIVAATEGYLKVAGKTKEELLGERIFESFPVNPEAASDNKNEVKASFDKVVTSKGSHTLAEQRYDVLNTDSVFIERYWKIINNPIFDERGEVEYIVHSVEEITDRILAKKLEQEHQELTGEKAYLQGLINLFPNPLQVLEPILENGELVDFCYKMTNAAYAAYANTVPEELQNKRVGDVFPGYFRTTSFTNIVETYKTGLSNTWEIHYDMDGLDIYNEMSATKMDGEVVVHFTEFTKLKHLQLELERKVAELERSNRHLEEFAHAASHDLKEPVRKIQVFTGHLKSYLTERLSATEQHTFKRIESATSRMGLLIDDLLQYSLASEKPVQMEAVDLAYIVKQVVEDLEVDIEQKGATITIDPLPVVQGFSRQLQQLLQNLISNALKYSKEEEPPRIEIRAESAVENGRPYHVISVKDNGIGFEQQYEEKIFQMFARLHGKGEYSGTGVGLSIVKKVVENHNGIIRVESDPGEGSHFRLYLPA